MKVVPEQNWEFYSYTTDTGPVVVGFHADADRINRDVYPHCARVIITIKRPNETGGPQRDEAEVLWAMEDRLAGMLEQHNVSCLLLGRLTHSGVRELVFQVSDWTPFRPPVGRWMQLHPDYETDVSEHEGWDFFYSFVWPSAQSWMLIQDRRVVDQLVQSGSDPQKPHSLEYVFRGALAQLQAMRDLLITRGYSVVEFQPDESRLVMAKSFTLEVASIYRESIRHQEDCRKLGIEYDGWGCLVVK